MRRTVPLKGLVLLAPLFVIHGTVTAMLWLAGKSLLFLLMHRHPVLVFSLADAYWISALSLIGAGAHWASSYASGARIIVSRLSAKRPDRSDRYHKTFQEIVEGMRLAGGLPPIEAIVIPAWTHNALSVSGWRFVPVVAVSEGMVSSLDPEELRGVVAHELAHVMRGDASCAGLSASMTNSVYWMIRLFRLDDDSSGRYAATLRSVFYLIVYYLMRFLSCFINRERELLADATAVEMTGNPLAMAKALYKSQLSGTNPGNHLEGYTPLFILAPRPRGVDSRQGFWADRFSTHPPLGKRLFHLLAMANRSFEELQALHQKEKRVYDSSERTPSVKKAKHGSAWLVMDRWGQWKGPYALNDAVNLDWFHLSLPVRLAQGESDVEEIPDSVLRQGVRARYLKSFRESFHLRIQKNNFETGSVFCPICGTGLDKGTYEGVFVRSCASCGGKLLREDGVDRILLRTELVFSERFRNRVSRWRDRWMPVPFVRGRFSSEWWCPLCGLAMDRGPFSTSYHLVVDRCLRCRVVWFDRDELEALQVLVEPAPQAEMKNH